jgi:hypothetical protein
MSCPCNTVDIPLLVILSPAMVSSLLHSGPLIAPTLDLPTAIPDYWVSKQLLHWPFSNGHCDAFTCQVHPIFVIVHDLAYTLMAFPTRHLLDSRADLVTLRSTA